MKKLRLYSLFLTSLFLIVMPIDSASAEDSNPDNNEEIKNIAENNWYLYVSAFDNTTNLDSYYLGDKIENKYTDSIKNSTEVFPVVDKESQNIVYTFQVSKHEDHSAILETNLANELNKEKDENVRKSISDGSDIPEETIPSFNKKIVNNFLVREIQTSKPWCLYYAYASVINTLENKQVTSAYDLVKYNFPNATEAQLMDNNYISTTKGYENTLSNLSKKTGYKHKFLTGRLNNTAYKNEINNNRSFVMDIRNNKVAHAITAIGYIEAKDPKLSDFYITWNPTDYNGGYQMIPSNQLDTISSGSEQLSWKYTIYDFKK